MEYRRFSVILNLLAVQAEKTALHRHTEYHHGVGDILGMDGFRPLPYGFLLFLWQGKTFKPAA